MPFALQALGATQRLFEAVSGGAEIGMGESEPVSLRAELLANDPAALVVRLDGVDFVLERTHSESRGLGSVAWWGRVDERTPESQFTLEQGRLVATIHADGRTYRVRPDSTGEHRLEQIHRMGTEEPDQYCASPRVPGRDLLQAVPSSALVAEPGHLRTNKEAGRATIDVMVVYTSKFRDEMGGTAAAEAQIQSAINYLDRAFGNSGVNAGARLVYSGHLAQLDGVKDLDQALDRVSSDAQVAALRDQYGADVVTMATGRGDVGTTSCGLGYVLDKSHTASSFAPFAFNAVSGWSSCGLEETFAHEVGHNLGLNHDPGNSGIQSSEAFRPFAYGHFDSSAGWRTIMSYGARLQVLPQFSDPDRSSGGSPTGIAGERDNAATLRESVTVANGYRATRVSTPATPSGLLATLLDDTTVLLEWSDNSNNEDSFLLEQRKGSQPFQQVKTLPANTTSVTITGLQETTAYSYRLRASAGVVSGYSNTTEITTGGSDGGGSGGGGNGGGNDGGGGGSGSNPMPVDPTLEVVSSDRLRVSWSGKQSGTVVEIEARSAGFDWKRLAEADGAGRTTVISGLKASTPYSFRLRRRNGKATSAYTAIVSATTAGVTGPCRPDSTHLCLLDERFEIGVQWRTGGSGADSGVGRSIPVAGSERTGMFWFFREQNVELIVKMLDGSGSNSSYWYFYGALSDVEYWVTVRDTMTEMTRTYHNTSGELCGVADVRAFSVTQGSSATAAPTDMDEQRWLSQPLEPVLDVPDTPAVRVESSLGTCVETATRLCLDGRRFSVEVTWKNPHNGGQQGVGQVLRGLSSADTGFFWFFGADNIELAVKILDGTAINGRFWVYWGALTDVEYTIKVTDTVTRRSTTYTNPALSLCGGSDTNAL